MNIWGYLMIVSGILLFLSFVNGYVLYLGFYVPRLLKKHGIDYATSGDWFRGDLGLSLSNGERDLISLSSKVDDPKVKQTLKIINFYKYSIIIFLVLFIVFAVIYSDSQPY